MASTAMGEVRVPVKNTHTYTQFIIECWHCTDSMHDVMAQTAAPVTLGELNHFLRFNPRSGTVARNCKG